MNLYNFIESKKFFESFCSDVKSFTDLDIHYL